MDGSGISTLMSGAGLTNGAFYAHFASKDDLVAHVVADELRTRVARYGTLRPGRADSRTSFASICRLPIGTAPASDALPPP